MTTIQDKTKENATPSLADIIEAVTQACAPGKLLHISGYVSGSGAVRNYTLRKATSSYRDLVRDSLQQVTDSPESIYHDETFPDADWNAALEELKASWQRTQDHAQPSRNFSKKLIDHGSYFTQEGVPDVIILRNFEKVSEFTVSEPEDQNASMKRMCKTMISQQVPLGRYLGQLNLAPHKIRAIAVSDDPAAASSESDQAAVDVPAESLERGAAGAGIQTE